MEYAHARQTRGPVFFIGDLNGRTAGQQPTASLTRQFPRQTEDKNFDGNASDIMALLKV